MTRDDDRFYAVLERIADSLEVIARRGETVADASDYAYTVAHQVAVRRRKDGAA